MGMADIVNPDVIRHDIEKAVGNSAGILAVADEGLGNGSFQGTGDDTQHCVGVRRILTTITENLVDDLGPDTPGDSHSGIQTNKLSNRSDQTHVTYEDSAFSERHEQSNKHVYNQNQEPDSNTPSPQPTKASDKRTDKDVSEEAIKQRAKNSVREGKDFERVVERERSEIYDDLAYASVGVPRLHRDWEHKYFKILVCGESGLGKTTFIKNLFASYANDPDLKVNDASASTAARTFVESPEKLMTEVTVEDKKNLLVFHYRIQDTPGHSIQKDVEPILQYIANQYHDVLRREQDVKRHGPLHEYEDPRVDVALYFLSPHRVKVVDVEVMARISAMVPVIPILAKADSMTVEELVAYRQEVRKLLTMGKRPIMYTFPNEVLDRVGCGHDVPPFSVIGSLRTDNRMARFWPVREYPWGVVEPLRTKHSDMAVLKKLLFEESFVTLKQETERRYYVYRQREIGDDDFGDFGYGREDPRSVVTQLRELVRNEGLVGRKKNPIVKFLESGKNLIGVGLAIVAAIALTSGGPARLAKDLEVVQKKTAEAAAVAAEVVQDVAGTVVDKTGDAVGVVAEKAGQAADVAKDKAGAVASLAADKATDAAGVVVDAASSALDRAADARDSAAHGASKAAKRAAGAAGGVKDKAGDVTRGVREAAGLHWSD